MKYKKMKGNQVLIVGSGSTINIYFNEIKKWIKNNNPIIIACNHITIPVFPDYHFWGDTQRYKKFGSSMNKESVPVFSRRFPKKKIRRYWNKEYITINFTKKKIYKDYRIKYEKEIMFGRFRTIGSVAILWAYINKFTDINIVGMDGYSLFNENDYLDKKESQHCWGRGYTDYKRSRNSIKFGGNKLTRKTFLRFCLKKDKEIYKTLIELNKYGVNFKILTPTVYNKFYDSYVFRQIND